ncbi:MAG: HEAT repeat domain-containing protein [Deltaproteobacteria bacterium]|nr:HEAT repeat domain-containing protein [Deltaproteobacteria bacterium]
MVRTCRHHHCAAPAALAAALALAALGGAPAAWAQPGPVPPGRSGRLPITLGHLSDPEEESGESSSRQPSLRERLDVRRGLGLLAAGRFEERARGIARLGAAGTPEAAEALVTAMAAGSAVRTDPRTRLAAVRALAPYARQGPVVQILVEVLGADAGGEPESPVEALARATAAMALARGGEEQAVTALVGALAGGGRAAEPARLALLAYPPAQVAAFSGPPGSARSGRPLSPALSALLGEIGDVRALGMLRRELGREDERVRGAAAVALARLGDGSIAPAVRAWLGSRRPALVRAAAEALALLGAPEATAATAALLRATGTREAGLHLAAIAPSPALGLLLAQIASAASAQEQRTLAVVALGRAGGEPAVAALARLLADEALSRQAALALATSADAAAGLALGLALGRAAGTARRTLLRAGVVRALERAERVAGIEAALEAALGSAAPADRAVGAFGLAALGVRQVRELVGSAHPEVRFAAARAALALGPAEIQSVAGLLGEPAGDAEPAEDATVAEVAGLASLLATGDALPSSLLARWAELGGPAAPLAARELAARDPAPFRPRLRALLAGTDPLVRAHVAMGLGTSEQPDAASLLADAYRFEPEPLVRRALVRALGERQVGRGERFGRPPLQLAAALDPDAQVRAVARAALVGRSVPRRRVPAGSHVAWIALRPSEQAGGKPGAGQAGRAAPAFGRLVRADGLCLPVVADPDGELLVGGIEPGERPTLQLAPAPE